MSQVKSIGAGGSIWLALVLMASSVHSAAQSIQHFDDQVLIDLSHTRTKTQTDLCLFLSHTNDYVNIGVPVVLCAGGLIANDHQMLKNSLYIGSSTVVSYLLMTAIKVIVKRPRPFIANININPVYQPASYSFPSGHTSSSFTTATALSAAYPRWYVVVPSFLWASSVSYSRLYLGVHNPTDVAAGAVLGVGSSLSLQFLRR